MARNALVLEFGSAARLSKRLGSVWNCLWGHALKRSPGINRKIRVSYPCPGCLLVLHGFFCRKKHYSGLKLKLLREQNLNHHQSITKDTFAVIIILIDNIT